MILHDKTIISTRPKGRNNELRRLIEQHGGTLLELPMIEIKACALSNEDRTAMGELEQYQWIVFTSPNGIRHFFKHAGEHRQKPLPTHIKCAAIGRKTAEHLNAYGYQAQAINQGNTSHDFADYLKDVFKDKKPNVLWPTGNLSRLTLKHKLAHVANVQPMVVYHTTKPDAVDNQLLAKVAQGHFDMLVFTSPSGFDNFIEYTGIEPDKFHVPMASIGYTTTGSIQQYGFIPAVTARMSSSDGIVDSIVQYFNEKQSKQ